MISKNKLLQRFADIKKTRPDIKVIAYDAVIDIIRSEPNEEWIIKKHPEKSGIYLVTLENGEVDTAAYSAVNRRFNKDVIAWQHLPGGYKE